MNWIGNPQDTRKKTRQEQYVVFTSIVKTKNAKEIVDGAL